MAQFKFSLDALLKQRLHHEQLAQREMAEKQQILVGFEQKLASVQTQMKEVQLGLKNSMQGTISVQLLMSHRRFLAAVNRQVVEIAQQMGGARLAVETSRRKLIKAATERKALETLRDTQKQRWQLAQARLEQAASDEIGMQIAYANLSR
jgi:flagellar protein FliJ